MKSFPLPVIIIFAGIVIAGSIISLDKETLGSLKAIGSGGKTAQIEKNALEFEVEATRKENKRILGNPDTPIKIVEFSDYECHFCNKLHPTLKRLLEEYPDKVHWEYRHLPLVIHINARESSLAAECVGDLAGNEAFWDYSDFLFANQRSLHPDIYYPEAAKHGISEGDFNTCMKSDEMSARLLADEQIAMSLGAGGTPFSVVVYEDGEQKPVSGALPYEQWVRLISN